MTTAELTTLRDDLENTYRWLGASVRAAFAAETSLRDAEREHQLARQKILLGCADDPKQLGSNEAAREARLADLTSESGSLVRLRETEARDYRHRLELARLDVEAVRARLRLAEVAAGVVRNF